MGTTEEWGVWPHLGTACGARMNSERKLCDPPVHDLPFVSGQRTYLQKFD